jgi:hypothetical protein
MILSLKDRDPILRGKLRGMGYSERHIDECMAWLGELEAEGKHPDDDEVFEYMVKYSAALFRIDTSLTSDEIVLMLVGFVSGMMGVVVTLVFGGMI